VGTGVAWKPTFGQWQTREISLNKGKEVFDAELQGICEALETAQILGNNGRVTVLLDSQAAISRLQDTELGPGQALTLRAAKMLREREIKVTIRWVEGNERADQAAKRAAARAASEEELSLAYVRRAGTEARREEGKKWLNAAMAHKPLRARRAYRVTEGFKQDPTAAAAPNPTASRYYQLKTGHAAVGSYLHKIKAQEDQACQWCRAPHETANHLLFECREWRVQRKTLQGDLIRARVQYTAAGEVPGGRLFADQKATKALLTFIATTGVGMRCGEEAWEAEAQRGNEWGIGALEDEEGEGEN
jgi:Reverse transcriptase-like